MTNPLAAYPGAFASLQPAAAAAYAPFGYGAVGLGQPVGMASSLYQARSLLMCPTPTFVHNDMGCYGACYAMYMFLNNGTPVAFMTVMHGLALEGWLSGIVLMTVNSPGHVSCQECRGSFLI